MYCLIKINFNCVSLAYISIKNLSFTRPHIFKIMIISSFLKGFPMFFCQTICYTYTFSLQFIFLFSEILHLVLYLATFIMIDLLLPLFLGAPSPCFILFDFFSHLLDCINHQLIHIFIFLILGGHELAISSSLITAIVYLSYLLRILLLQTYH